MLSYCLFLLAFGLVCAVLLYFRTRKADFCALSFVFGAVFGFAAAKIGYCLIQFHFVAVDGLEYSVMTDDPGLWCFTFGAAGVALGIALTARLRRLHVMEMLDSFAPIGALLAAAARFGDLFLQDFMTGWGSWVENPLPFPLAIRNSWDEYYVAVFMLEGACALVVAIVSFLRWKQDGFLRTVFYLCLCQILCESLHNDSLSWLFVRVEQLMCMLILTGILVWYMVKMGPRKGRLIPLWVCLACAAVFIGIEFALQKTTIPVPVLYGTMVLGLIALGVTETKAHRLLGK